eukprot:Plantae.Rhodophyta-Purpureofilum_apyrenoidigerum.ctg6813.p1 GENE.Plantae.Rhodophyta-Purpureofilum_apyrenoidigerum.ctg6813~~Plantae.Rhodophyta-Purpureofilum_apyrenoidigerum.ctg6813.p1  ORF type:complete len:197 (+),score=36.28 Plantae.Rhodophyta-Purpureofilum_apyrenoidigerum.ctg6813:202-792(+)
MASAIWVATFVLLCVEVVLCAVMMVPLPRSFWRQISSILKITAVSNVVTFFVRFLILGLALGVFESVQIIRRLQDKAEGSNDMYAALSVSQKKQRMFRAERNLYLAGFCLTLIFVIQRVIQLATENSNLSYEIEKKKKTPITSTQSTSATSSEVQADSNQGENGLLSAVTDRWSRQDGVPAQRKGYTTVTEASSAS